MGALPFTAALAALAAPLLAAVLLAAGVVACRAAPAGERPSDPSDPSDHGGRVMSAAPLPPAEALSPDLIPFIGDRSVRMVVAAIAEVRLTPEKSGEKGAESGLEAGPVTLEVIEVLAGSAPRAGERVVVPARRKIDMSARARSNFDQWNVLALDPGRALLAALAPTDAPGVYRALAAQAITSAADPAVQAVRRDYAIEALPDGDRRAPLERALQSEERLERYYALAAIEDRGLLGRQAGAEVIAAAIVSPATSAAGKLDLAVYLTHPAFFDKRRETDPTNRLVVATLSRALLAEHDPERRLGFSRALAAVVLPALAPSPEVDRARRATLLRGAGVAFPDVDRALADLLPHAEDDAERAGLERLRAAFRALTP